MLQTVCGDEVLNHSSAFDGLNGLQTGVSAFRMIQEPGVPEPLEMQTQSQISVKWWHMIYDGLSE
jgi:hypothetical protein